ncbi:hypothetical protein F3Y22_tig00111582pilonHSYRG00468 [Hibiscus syriacus]|uniref:Ubiquitin-like protease family profile domain-containing protein n=1 Tax=Hibiscus syriacus TaxID=106335 RepID=A0A6A2YIS6_HIBSY|nr:hypothetical protein F3Y22_tig00111582pilonHSYRG00468 [Hibiscus syriacus]
MKSKDLGIIGGEYDFEIEAEGRKQPKGGYIYFYMIECQKMKEGGKHIGSVRNDVLEKWNSMSDAENEPFIVQSKKDSEEYKEWRKAHEKKARVLLYLVEIFLCPTGDTSTNKDNIKLLCDEGLKGEFNWAKYVHSRLIKSIITFQKGSQRYLKGCIAILEVIGKGVEEAENKEEEMVVGVDDGQGDDNNQESKRHLRSIRGKRKEKIDGVVKEVEVLRGELKMVEKADIPSKINELEDAMCDYLWNSGYFVISMGNQYASVSDVATLNPTEWVGGVVIDLLAWTVCYDSKKSLRRIGYLPYHLVGPILDNYVKFTDCEKIMITINYHNSYWYLLVLDMVERSTTFYDSLFISEEAKQRVNDAKRLVYSYNKKRNWVKTCGSLGKVPLENFKFVEHKMNEQLNGYDCGIYVMMRMESISSRGATGDFVVGHWDRMRILNDLG